jgi:hypothetical protein
MATTALEPGSTLNVTCTTTLTVKVAKNKKSVTITCAPVAGNPSPTPTNTPVSAPSQTPTAVATSTSVPPTPVPPTATAAPGGGDTFPAVNALILGTCSAQVHDRYKTVGPDGRTYRTWHPVTVPVDPSNPAAGTCTFAHEHGDAPHPSMPLPPFGYAAAVDGMFAEIVAHSGFKVFTHYADGRSGLGSQETDYGGLPMDFSLVFHQGSGGAGRLTIQMHSFEFWSRYQNRQTHVYAMADTGLPFDKAVGGGSDCCDRFIVSHEAYTYETWGVQVNIGGAWNTGSMFSAVTNPMNHAHGNIASCQDGTCDGVTMVSTSEEICGFNFTECSVKLPFGQHGSGHENMWLGNFRTIHEPDWTWNNQGGQETFCTDAMGMRMACGPNTIQQQVATVNVSNASARTLLRTPNESGWDNVYWLPLGAPGGN